MTDPTCPKHRECMQANTMSDCYIIREEKEVSRCPNYTPYLTSRDIQRISRRGLERSDRR